VVKVHHSYTDHHYFDCHQIMSKHLYIITGASRGMGLCLAEQLLAPENQLLCISRHDATHLALRAQQTGMTLDQWHADLADVQPVCERLKQWLRPLSEETFASATLINNAGMIPPLAPLSESNADDLSRALRVGLEAPMLLTATFLAVTRQWRVARRVLNISSGLGRRPMASQSAYCAAKAGMDHFTRCLALDEARQANGAKVVSLAPGVIDTDMQSQLRQAKPEDFPDQVAFAQLKEAGHLASAQEAATRVLRYLQRAGFGCDPVADVRG